MIFIYSKICNNYFLTYSCGNSYEYYVGNVLGDVKSHECVTLPPAVNEFFVVILFVGISEEGI
jgi:hypothetical protein